MKSPDIKRCRGFIAVLVLVTTKRPHPALTGTPHTRAWERGRGASAVRREVAWRVSLRANFGRFPPLRRLAWRGRECMGFD